MNTDSPKMYGTLDRIRMQSGIHDLTSFFGNLSRTAPEEAAALMNDESLCYGSLFLLRPYIKAYGLAPRLNPRCRDALAITDRLLWKKTENKSLPATREVPPSYPVLRWIFTTGYRDDGLSSDYEQVMELTAAILTKMHQEHSILPQMITMIFNRHRKKHFNHTLIWALLECKNPDSLLMIASRLCSPYLQDVKLARKLLGFVPGLAQDTILEGTEQYRYFLQWFDENRLFLHYTGESFHQCCKPILYTVALDAKYLYKPVSIETGKPLEAWTDLEKRLLHSFNQLSQKVREKLSSYSFLLYRRNIRQWQQWILSPLPEQIRAMEKTREGRL